MRQINEALIKYPVQNAKHLIQAYEEGQNPSQEDVLMAECMKFGSANFKKKFESKGKGPSSFKSKARPKSKGRGKPKGKPSK